MPSFECRALSWRASHSQGAQLARFNDITLQLSSLSTNFSNNVVDATAGFTKLINDSAQMAGLPASYRAQAAQTVRCSGA
jgi:oligopeptidase A